MDYTYKNMDPAHEFVHIMHIVLVPIRTHIIFQVALFFFLFFYLHGKANPVPLRLMTIVKKSQVIN